MDNKSILKFSNPQFKEGINSTVRRGVKWATIEGKVAIYDLNGIQHGWMEKPTSYVISFQDLKAEDLENQHDERTRTPLGLLQVMQEVYPGFRDAEIVTVLEFEVSNG